MTDIPILGQESKADKIDRLTFDVVALLATTPLGGEELIGIIELCMLDTISNLAGYVYEMQNKILGVLGAIPEPGQPTAEDFAGSYIEDYTLLRMARTRSLLMKRAGGDDDAPAAEGDDGG